jgi:hypothetical protein
VQQWIGVLDGGRDAHVYALLRSKNGRWTARVRGRSDGRRLGGVVRAVPRPDGDLPVGISNRGINGRRSADPGGVCVSLLQQTLNPIENQLKSEGEGRVVVVGLRSVFRGDTG